MLKIISTAAELEALPINAAIDYLPPGAGPGDRPRIVVHTPEGEWVFVNHVPGEGYRSIDLIEKDARVRVIFDPADHTGEVAFPVDTPAERREPDTSALWERRDHEREVRIAAQDASRKGAVASVIGMLKGAMSTAAEQTHPAWAGVGRVVNFIERRADMSTEVTMTAVVAHHTTTQVVLHNGDRFVAKPGGYYKTGQARTPVRTRIEEYVPPVLDDDGTARDLETVVRDVLSRKNDVREWPADEQELHREWRGDFTSRSAAVTELRVRKILRAAQVQATVPTPTT